ncbi:MAG: ABC transporter substrate-binding protein [Dehalococcoidales bacterium]|nr:ABC transporter substrate-binding protein [Dehalococcoidales bacterium]
MKERITWLIISSLVVLSMVAAACGAPAVTEEPKVETPKVETPAVEEPKVVEPEVEKPKYGGILRIAATSDMDAWDDRQSSLGGQTAVQLDHDTLLTGDWALGTAGGYGADLTSFKAKVAGVDLGLVTGAIAEDWEFKVEGDKGILTYTIRQGVHFAVNPDSAHEASEMVGGREMTVDDVIATLTRAITDPKGRWYVREPLLRDALITSPEPWVVRIEVPVEGFLIAKDRFSSYMLIWPKEILEEFGTNRNMDWRVSVGTGPFILTDHVPSSSDTFIRNPNYWMMNPIGPGKGDQLPYVGGVKIFTIPDKSTLYAALRSAQIDIVGSDKEGLSWEDAEAMLRQKPELLSKEKGLDGAGPAISFNTRKPPFNDIRVRRALFMATDFNSIRDNLFGGHGQIVTFPFPYIVEYADAYFGPEATGEWPADTPASVIENFTYNPEKAKQLLAEAGYPQGFQTSIQYNSEEEEDSDYFSVIKAMWSMVGVDLELKPMESTAAEVIHTSYDYDALFGITSGLDPQMAYQLAYTSGARYPNLSFVDDPFINETFVKIQEASSAGNKDEMNLLTREAGKYALEQAWMIGGVDAPDLVIWWPWIKNFSGEFFVGNLQRYAWTYVWLDQQMKKEMGH